MSHDCEETCLDKGYCDKHHLEIERRRNSDEKVKQIPWIMTTVNRIIGYSVLATLFILGSYSYTMISNAATDKKIESANDQITELTKEISRLTTVIATTTTRGDERHKALVQQLEDTNVLLRSLIIEQRNSTNNHAYDNGHYNTPKYFNGDQ